MKKVKVPLSLEPLISTERWFLKHFVKGRSKVIKSQRNIYFFSENQCFKNEMIDYAHQWVTATYIYYIIYYIFLFFKFKLEYLISVQSSDPLDTKIPLILLLLCQTGLYGILPSYSRTLIWWKNPPRGTAVSAPVWETQPVCRRRGIFGFIGSELWTRIKKIRDKN